MNPSHFWTFRLPLAAAVILAAGGVVVGSEGAGKAAPAAAAMAQQPVSPEQIDKLIAQLGDTDYYVRQRAQEALARLGFDAFDALSAATTHDDLEIASRAKYLLRLMRVEWTVKTDPPEVRKCLQDYEQRDADERRAKMRLLAGLPDGKGIEALCRLARFEKSSILAKAAALEVLQSKTAETPPQPAVVAIVRKMMAGCNRPCAAWLLAWTRLAADPEATMAEWSRLVEAETAALQRGPGESRPEIVAGLIRFQMTQWKRLGKPNEMMAAFRRLMDLEQNDPDSLGELLDWLVEQKAWKAVEELAQRFARRFATEPGLLYTLAQSYLEQGQKDRGEKTAARALRLHPGKQEEKLEHHRAAAESLRQRGLFAWARREYEHIISQGAAAEWTVLAQMNLATMLHDQGEDLDAATIMESMLKSLDARKAKNASLPGMARLELRAQANYFYACHWLKQGDAAKHREYLDKALTDNPADVDVLIACYRLPDQAPEFHAKIVDLLKRLATRVREKIAMEGENGSSYTLATDYNQLAWLIGNTEGDFDEALKCSEKSLELMPESGGYYDTLARVYYAKGDLENAVKTQTRALELEPHSGLMQRQLELFRKALDKKKPEEKKAEEKK